MFAKAMHSAKHPILAQIIPIRRCNLACGYCNEYDDRSAPVPTEEMLRRLDRLAELGTTIITFSGGEPTLHPDLDTLIARVRSNGGLATLITNGLLLTPERIQRLNRAGLDYLQISIDNLQPDGTSHKSLRVLDKKLEWLAAHAEFSVTINSVLGASIPNPADAHAIALRARELGFTSTVGVLHDHSGQLRPLADSHQSVYQRILGLGGGLFSFAHFDRFQLNITRGLPNDWHCRAGARFLYICEDGLVHYCSQQRGRPGIPLAEYGADHMAQAFHEKKGCAPFCTISCVHQTAMLDSFREQPRETLAGILARRKAQDPAFTPPPLVRFLDWAFLRSSRRGVMGKVALRLFGIR
jgi:MoaA/NifB/PqqE/SkfB family radical SAM enzyme